MRQRRRSKAESAKCSRLSRQSLLKRQAVPPKKRVSQKITKPSTQNKHNTKLNTKIAAVISSVCLSSVVFVGSTTAQAAGFTDALKFLTQAKQTMGGFFAAGSLVALGGELSNATMMQNHSKSSERLSGAIVAIAQVDAMKDVLHSKDANSIPDSLKCSALYDNKYSLFQNLMSKEYTFQQMSLAATTYSKDSETAKAENMARNMNDYCSIDETKMEICTFHPDGTAAMSQDYGLIQKSKRMDPIAQTAATDLANNLVLISQSSYAQNCDTADCARIRDVERQYITLASLVHGSILGQVNASLPLAYEPLRDYVNENMGINT
ncbi:MAG: hypothetical protein J6N72_09515, partial [Psychrobacter sp.]|nr:hypothetical protein [Psychrobacter sp.]